MHIARTDFEYPVSAGPAAGVGASPSTRRIGVVLFDGGRGALRGPAGLPPAGLQQYGSIMGHGGHLEPDYTTEHLRRSSLSVLEEHYT